MILSHNWKAYTTNSKRGIVIIIVFGNADSSEHFTCFFAILISHLHCYYHQKTSTVTSMASPGLKLSKSLFCLAVSATSAASMDSCLINAFALCIRKNNNYEPFVRFFQLNMLIVLFDIERNRTNIIWRPLFRCCSISNILTWKICTQHLWTISRDIPRYWLCQSCQHWRIWRK